MEVIREIASRTQLGPQEFISGRFVLGRSHISGEWLLPGFFGWCPLTPIENQSS